MPRGKKGKRGRGRQRRIVQHSLQMQSEGEVPTECASDIDDDDFDSLRTDPDELADDLEALIDVLGTGTIPAWHAAPALAADLVSWLRHGEIPTLRSASCMALDLDIILDGIRSPLVSPLYTPADMAKFLKLAREAVDQ